MSTTTDPGDHHAARAQELLERAEAMNGREHMASTSQASLAARATAHALLATYHGRPLQGPIAQALHFAGEAPDPPAPPESMSMQNSGYHGPGTYLHYKGQEYIVIGHAREEATLEYVIVYYHVDHATDELWTRPSRDFNAFVPAPEDPQRQVPRFVKVKDTD